MGVDVQRAQGQLVDDGDVQAWFAARGLAPRSWSNGPGDRYASHRHGYHKILFCLSGSIVFHVDDDDIELMPGDRLDVEPGTEHAASVGPDGVRCMEAASPS